MRPIEPALPKDVVYQRSLPKIPVAIAVIALLGVAGVATYFGLDQGVNSIAFIATASVDGAGILALAFACYKCSKEIVSSAVQIANIQYSKDQTGKITTYQVTIPNNFSGEECRTWILSKLGKIQDPLYRENKRAMLETVGNPGWFNQLAANIRQNNGYIYFKQIEQTNEGFQEELNLLLPEKAVLTDTFSRGYFTYKPTNFCRDEQVPLAPVIPLFARTDIRGGTWRTDGCVQEERMVMESPLHMMLLYLLRHEPIDLLSPTRDGTPAKEPAADPTPFFLPNFYKEFDINQSLYGFDGVKDSNAHFIKSQSGIQSVKVTYSAVGIAAKRWERSKQRQQYSRQDILYHLKAFKLACEIQKVQGYSRMQISDWGCGAYLNNPKMMTNIMILGARMAGMQLDFCAVKNDNVFCRESILRAEQEMMKHETANSAIAYLLEQQESDPDRWGPKKERGESLR